MRKSKGYLAIALFLNAENPLRESPKTNGTGPKFGSVFLENPTFFWLVDPADTTIFMRTAVVEFYTFQFYKIP
jgi:hypothetical protein